MNRRSLLALPLLAALPCRLRAAPVWGHDVSEVRYGGSDAGTAARARALEGALGVRVRAVVLPPDALAAALDRGAVEFAALGDGARGRAVALMGERLAVVPGGVVRRALPGGLGAALGGALAFPSG